MSAAINTGTKIFTLLVEYNTRTGQPTGRVKPNIPSDPNYIGPVTDNSACPPPGSPVIPMENVTVQIGSGFSVVIHLLYGSAEITRSTSGTWNIVDRVYDAVKFVVTAATARYRMKIVYGSGQVKLIDTTTTGSYFIPGPFEPISSIIIESRVGDYSDDYNDDYSL